ncbi:hypothetical protein ES288_A11G066700v1 [Gossypium darwinii]|uniref:Uncharacterized protein n=2 Tax=Gossypium TaxID=3633 RepID=A0A5D2N7Z0_GOSTO|nr:hypothetical protein ES288_A11G066700v1 [Gossypium darwinii]TYH99444.1 hypothetical protein ES332_A11G066900v1 [Gossypium tomentosum]
MEERVNSGCEDMGAKHTNVGCTTRKPGSCVEREWGCCAKGKLRVSETLKI